MGKGLIITLSVLGILLLITITGLGTLWSNRNHAVALDERIESQLTANKSNYDNMWKKFLEITQVSELQAKQMKDVFLGLIEGRYKDPNLLFKMVQEDNPKIDSSVYVQIQREISAGRNTFDNNQKAISDMVREYNTFVQQKVIMAAVTGRIRKDSNKYIVTSDKTENAFSERKDDVIDITGGVK
jgi:hypothetical protein